MAALPTRHLLEPTGPLERRDRFPEEVERAKRLELQLGLPDAVLFNVPSATRGDVSPIRRTQPTSACRRTRKSKPSSRGACRSSLIKVSTGRSRYLGIGR